MKNEGRIGDGDGDTDGHLIACCILPTIIELGATVNAKEVPENCDDSLK